jgi:gliding motility-associated-like protein
MIPPAQRYTEAGDFVIELLATNSSGCTDTATKNLRVNPLPVITVQPSFTSLVGVPVSIQPVTYSSNVIRYEWTPPTGLTCTDCPQPVAMSKFNTVYSVVATDSNGCRNSASTEVIVLCREANVFVPNTFSPNGDGSNDVFYVRGFGLARVKSLRIYNRLGEIVFQRQNFVANSPASGWDGTYKGVKLSPDTFIYQLDVFCENSQTVRFDGSISLIR